MKYHEYANIFPLLEGEEFDRLVADVKQQGILEPITTHEGTILDGRNRWRACQIAGVTPTFVEYKGTDPLGFVIAKNVFRRHLTKQQREVAMMRALPAAKKEAAKRMVAPLKKGSKLPVAPNDASGEPRKAVADVAKMFGVGPRTVERAAEKFKQVEANPQMKERFMTGKVTLDEAVKELRMDEIGKRVDAKAAKKVKAAVEEHPRAVAAYMDALKVVRGAKDHAVEAAKQGKFSPEAQRFVRNWHDSIRAMFTQIEEQFNG